MSKKNKTKIISKKSIIILIFLILINLMFLNSNFANTVEVNSYKYLKLNITNNIGFGVNLNQNSIIKKFYLNSYFFPQTFDGSQYLNSFNSSNKNYLIMDNENKIYNLKYEYKLNSLKNQNNINNTFILESTINQPKIKNKVNFPIQNLKSENLKYLEFTDLIQTNLELRNQALKIIDGETDLFLVASKIAKWVREDITYDLSSINELPNQNSIEVFKTKRGVCKEITNLYLSMLRSLNIPSRIVTGYSYTNSVEIYNLIGSNWGGHAWAEVLIGDTWVPFDLTYDQYGFVDASHIILDKSVEIKKSSVSINASGVNFDLIQNSLKIKNDFKILDKKNKNTYSGFSASILGSKNLGFGSYGYIKLKIKNKDDFYKIMFIKLLKPKEVKNIPENSSVEQMLIFMPNEEKEILFKFKIDKNLDNNYAYTFPFEVNANNFKMNYSINVENKFPKLNLIDLPIKKIKKKEFTLDELKTNCEFKINEKKNLIICNILNPQTFKIKNLQICLLNNSCNTINLNQGENKTIIFQSEKESEILNYKIYNKEINLTLNAKLPRIIYNKKINGNILNLNTFIYNFKKDYNINVYLNNNQIFRILNESEIINIKLKDKNNQIRIDIKKGEKQLSKIEFNQSLENRFVLNKYEKQIEKSLAQDTSNLNYISQIKSFFNNIFDFIILIFN